VGFSVDVVALGGLPDQLERVDADAVSARGYVREYSELRYGGLLNTLTGAHRRAVDTVSDFLERLATPVAGNTAQAVRQAIIYYIHADDAAAARLDSSYPLAAQPGSAQEGGKRLGLSFSDTDEPTRHLLPPLDRSEQFPYEPTPLVLISPAAFGRMIIVEATTLAAKLRLGHRWDP
jgi:hypothetical protein